MNTTTKKIGDYEQEVTVEYDAAELEKAKKRACKQLSERTTIPGFRKGKVPPTWVIEQHLGKGIILDEAADILIQQAANDLIDKQNIVPVTKMKQKIITCEEHSIIGGLGEAVCSLLSEKCPTPVRRIGVNDEFGHSGPAAELLKSFGLSAEHIAAVAREFVKE